VTSASACPAAHGLSRFRSAVSGTPQSYLAPRGSPRLCHALSVSNEGTVAHEQGRARFVDEASVVRQRPRSPRVCSFPPRGSVPMSISSRIAGAVPGYGRLSGRADPFWMGAISACAFMILAACGGSVQVANTAGKGSAPGSYASYRSGASPRAGSANGEAGGAKVPLGFVDDSEGARYAEATPGRSAPRHAEARPRHRGKRSRFAQRARMQRARLGHTTTPVRPVVAPGETTEAGVTQPPAESPSPSATTTAHATPPPGDSIKTKAAEGKEQPGLLVAATAAGVVSFGAMGWWWMKRR